jgi:hypothetical protein
MDGSIKTAIIAATAGIVTAFISAYATISASEVRLRQAAAEATVATDRARSAAADVSSLLRHVYDNGTISASNLAGGKMVVLLNGSADSGPVSISLDMTRLTSMCGDADGCSVLLGATHWRMWLSDGSTFVLDAPLQGPPCRFFFSTKSSHWSLSQSCVAMFALAATDDKGTTRIAGQYQAYDHSNVYGVDDSEAPALRDPDREPRIVLSFKGACYLAESAADPRSRVGSFMPDDKGAPSTGRGLFLIASAPGWDPVYPTKALHKSSEWPAEDASRQCVLIVDD